MVAMDQRLQASDKISIPLLVHFSSSNFHQLDIDYTLSAMLHLAKKASESFRQSKKHFGMLESWRMERKVVPQVPAVVKARLPSANMSMRYIVERGWT